MMEALKVMTYFKVSLSTHNWDKAIKKGHLLRDGPFRWGSLNLICKLLFLMYFVVWSFIWVLPLVLLLVKVPPLLLVFDPLAPPFQHNRKRVQIPFRMLVQIPVLHHLISPCEQFTNLRSSTHLGMRNLRSCLTSSIRRNPLCCLG